MKPGIHITALLFLPIFLMFINCISSQNKNGQETSTADFKSEQSKELIIQRKVSSHDGHIPPKILEIIEEHDEFFIEGVSVLQDNDESTLYTLFNRKINAEDYVIWYDKELESVENEIRLSDLNPFFQKGYDDESHHQLAGINKKVNLSIKDISDVVNVEQFNGIIDEYHVSEINVPQRVVTTCSQCPIVLHFGLNLLPGNEILENVPYPGVTTLIVYNSKGNEKIGETINLPFSISEIVAPKNKETLLFTHQVPNHKFGDRLLDDEFWSQMCSVYSLTNNRICFQSEEGYLFYAGYDSRNNLPYMQQYFDSDEWSVKEFVLVDNEVFEYTYLIPDFRRISEGVQIYANNTLVETLSYKDDFVKNKNTCNE
ncbi:hypothetical protein QWY85_17020 [Neolewinella lacunae]|uniref:Uncharacterized protein n=1 Tax=Neolewinella lacunae TaxID=1517758 RepID=A0A923PGJ6_9BACT|nr:hypothetical protein [Neolewinella lacunae]MBC6993675.1 hypothetical protein [Neolewinella lacunae]MDN3636370.1 hypothetical protein [Neolewinella lacunae]